MGKSITDFSSVTTVGLDLAKHVFQVHGVDSIRPRCAAFPRAVGLLARRWERARAGEGQLALIVGEPGLGASPTASSLSLEPLDPRIQMGDVRRVLDGVRERLRDAVAQLAAKLRQEPDDRLAVDLEYVIDQAEGHRSRRKFSTTAQFCNASASTARFSSFADPPGPVYRNRARGPNHLAGPSAL